MLKRFMAWLLSQLQNVWNTLSGRSRTQPSGRSPLINPTGNSTSHQSSDSSEVSVAERVQYDSPTAQNASVVQQAPTSSIRQTKIDQAKIDQADTDNESEEAEVSTYLDATSSSVSGISEEIPSLPSSVSDLMSLRDSNEDIVDAPVHTLHNLPEEQLPAIQDLLPAEQANPSSAELLSNKTDNAEDNIPILKSDAEKESKPVIFSFDIVESQTQENRDDVDPSPDEYGVDPTEQRSDEEELIEAIESTTVDSTVENNALADLEVEASNAPATEVFVSRDDGLVPEDATSTNDYTGGQTESIEASQEQTISIAPEADTPSDAQEETSRAEAVQSIPYPWSTISSKTGVSKTDLNEPGIESTESQGLLHIETRDQQEEQSLSSEETTSEAPSIKQESSDEKQQDAQKQNTSVRDVEKKVPSLNAHPTKHGTVKLLFTMKKGNFHGYITPDDGSKDILFHQKYINAEVFPRLERGTQVSATVKYIEGKAYATHVDIR